MLPPQWYSVMRKAIRKMVRVAWGLAALVLAWQFVMDALHGYADYMLSLITVYAAVLGGVTLVAYLIDRAAAGTPPK